MRVINEKGSEDENPIDRHYAALKCQLLPLGKEIEEYKVKKLYIIKWTDRQTHTHNRKIIFSKAGCTCMCSLWSAM